MRLQALRNFLVLFTSFSLFFAPSTLAKSGNSVTLSPAIVDIDGSAIQEGGYTVSIFNGSDVVLQVRLSFVPFEQNSDRKLVFNTKQNSVLSEFLIPSAESFQLDPRTTSAINLVPTSDLQLLKEDHFESIFFDISTVDTSDENGGKNTNISSSIALLVFFRNGLDSQVSFEANLLSKVSSVILEIPDKIELEIANSGNSYSVPRGLVRVKDHFERVVSQGILNTDSTRILPQQSKTIGVEMSHNQFSYPVSLVKLYLDIRDSKSEKTTSIFLGTFLFIDPTLLISLVIGVILVICWHSLRHARRIRSTK